MRPGITEIELDNTHPEPRMVITGDAETLRRLAGELSPARSDVPGDRRPVNVADAMSRHLARTPDTRAAYHTDAEYHRQVHTLRHLLGLVDAVLEDEGIPERTRERVVRCVLYGTPDPTDATLRIDARAAAARTAFTADALNDVLRGGPGPLRGEPA